MFSRPASFALFLCVLILTALSRAKPQNSNIKPAATDPKQSLVVNNNCGLAKSESEMLADIKAKVDSIAAKSSKGILYLQRFCLKLNSFSLIVCCWCVRAHSFISMNNNFKERKSFNG